MNQKEWYGVAWLIERGSQPEYIAFDDSAPAFVWTTDVNEAYRYDTERAATEALFVMREHADDGAETVHADMRGAVVREHMWLNPDKVSAPEKKDPRP